MTRFPLAAGLVALIALSGLDPAYAGTTLSYPIVDTGQTAHFDDYGATTSASAAVSHPGQDADYQGAQPSYRDNGDGTVTDLVTGLMWQKTYMSSSWEDADALAAAADTGGYTDWRVPTIKELYSLIQFTGNQGRGNPSSTAAPRDAVPFIDSEAFDFAYPDSGRYIDVQFITSTLYTGTVMNGQQCFFGVNFADGRIKCYPTASRRHENGDWNLRLVRGNPDYGLNSFADNGDGTVTERRPG